MTLAGSSESSTECHPVCSKTNKLSRAKIVTANCAGLCFLFATRLEQLHATSWREISFRSKCHRAPEVFLAVGLEGFRVVYTSG